MKQDHWGGAETGRSLIGLLDGVHIMNCNNKQVGKTGGKAVKRLMGTPDV